jgi:hypothetical protein
VKELANISIPADYAWSTWTLSNMTNNTTNITQTSTASAGTATSPGTGYDAGDGYVFDKLNWSGGIEYGIAIEARTATSASTISTSDYFTLSKDCTFPLAQRKRYIQIKATLTTANLQPALHALVLYSNLSASANTTDSQGLTQDAEGARPTWDNLFSGRKYQCAICGMTYRRGQMTSQRGKLVCLETCKDKLASDPSPIQVRRK